MTLVMVLYLPDVGRCVDFFTFCVKRYFFKIIVFFFPVVKMKLNIQTWGGGEIINLTFSSREQAATSASWPLWESQQSRQAYLFPSTDTVHWGSSRCRHTASQGGRLDGFYFPFLCSPSSRNFFSCWLAASPFQPCWGFGRWRGWRHLHQDGDLEGAGNVSARSVERAPQHLSSRKAGLNFTCVWFGVKLLWCHCWTDRVTVGRWNGDLRELQAGSLS